MKVPETVRIVAYYKQYGLLSDGTFFSFNDWMAYATKLSNVSPYEANKFFRTKNRFEHCRYVDPNNELSERDFGKFCMVQLLRKHKLKARRMI